MTDQEINLTIAKHFGEWERDDYIVCHGSNPAVKYRGTQLECAEFIESVALNVGQHQIHHAQMPYSYTTDDEAVRRVWRRMMDSFPFGTRGDIQLYARLTDAFCGSVALAILATPRQKAEALARLIQEEKGTK